MQDLNISATAAEYYANGGGNEVYTDYFGGLRGPDALSASVSGFGVSLGFAMDSDGGFYVNSPGISRSANYSSSWKPGGSISLNWIQGNVDRGVRGNFYQGASLNMSATYIIGAGMTQGLGSGARHSYDLVIGTPGINFGLSNSIRVR